MTTIKKPERHRYSYFDKEGKLIVIPKYVSEEIKKEAYDNGIDIGTILGATFVAFVATLIFCMIW